MDKDKTMLCKETFDTDSGKKFLEEVLSAMCKEKKPTYVGKDTHHSAYQEGQRSIMLGIRNMLNKDLGKEIQKKGKR